MKNSKCKAKKEAQKNARSTKSPENPLTIAKHNERAHQIPLSIKQPLQYPRHKRVPIAAFNERSLCPRRTIQSSTKAETAQTCADWPYLQNRVEALSTNQAQSAFTLANDKILKILQGLRRLQTSRYSRRRLHSRPFYGDINAPMIIGGKQDRGTCWGYHYASIHIVEASRRLTLYSMPIDQFTEKANAVATLLTSKAEKSPS